jgi:uncharacterized membrane protein
MTNGHRSFAASDSIDGDTGKLPLRSLLDRLRQIALYEIGGLALISPLFAFGAGISPASSIGLLAALSLIIGTWNGVYSTAFDWCERAITGQSADRRSLLARVAHAVFLEAGAVVFTTPLIAAWTDVSWKAAFIEDIGLTVVYVAYAFVFGLLYDSVFPIGSERHIAEAING